MAKTATKATKKRNPKDTTKYDLRGLYRRVEKLEKERDFLWSHIDSLWDATSRSAK